MSRIQNTTGTLKSLVTGKPKPKPKPKKVDTPPDPSPSQPSTTPSKARDLLALRTIIMMLSLIDSPDGRSLAPNYKPPLGILPKERKELKVLDALSAVLIREHEITAVMAKPYDGANLQVIGSVVHPSDAEPSLQPASSNVEPSLQPASNSETQGFWRRIRSNFKFAVTVNPRSSPINGHTDSLRNKDILPSLIACKDSVTVPPQLIATAKHEGNASMPLLDLYLKDFW
jgi:hypothetical protein